MKPIPVLIAFVMVLSSGLVHGLWTDRWHKSEALELAVGRVESVPLQLGGWKGQPLKTDTEEFEQAGALGYWMREYRNKHQSVTVLLMCGRAGRMSVHTPDICYQGLGYQMAGASQRVEVPSKGGRSAELWMGRFTKRTGSSSLRLYWSWNDGSGWLAPSSPRWQYRGKPFL